VLAISASEADVSAVASFLATAGIKHLHCRKRAATLIIESGPAGDAVPRLRLRKVSATIWATEAATHTGRWEAMPVRGSLRDNLQTVASTFPWLLAD
jgi:hypothetical protein